MDEDDAAQTGAADDERHQAAVRHCGAAAELDGTQLAARRAHRRDARVRHESALREVQRLQSGMALGKQLQRRVADLQLR